MFVEHALLIPSEWTVADAAAAIDTVADRVSVVVRFSDGDAERLYTVDAGTMRILIDGMEPALLVADALDMSPFPPNRALEVGDEPLSPAPGDCLVRHRELIGIVRAHGSDRGGGAALPPPPPVPPPPPGPPTVGPPGGAWTGGAAGIPGGDPDPGVGTGPAPSPDPDRVPRDTRHRFRAYASLEAPDHVEEGQQFTLRVGMAGEPQTDDPQETPIIVAGAPDVLRFVVQVTGFGFTFPDGISRELLVPRDAPEGPAVEFTVTAGDVRRRATRTLEVSFEFEGELCGMAWRDVLVTSPAGPNDPATPAAAPAPAWSGAHAAGGTGVALLVDGSTPDLTVEIRTEPGSPRVEWIFHTRDQSVRRPTHQVLSQFDAASAEAFAVQLMAQLPAAKGSALLATTVRGMGRTINRIIPDEFWEMVEAAWRAARDRGAPIPSLLLTVGEAFVPWELAWVDETCVAPDVLPQGVVEGPLGALWRIGRWVPPYRRRRGPDRPAAPPPVEVPADAVAVVIGDYAGDARIRDLPHARDECTQIALRYSGLPLRASEDDVARLMDATLQRDGSAFAPTVVHFAAHGQVSLTNAQHTGILFPGGRRLDVLTVEGSRLGEASSPFVFLNACQVGTAGRVLSTYGGLAGAFLSSGCRGFVAPLWNVDDDRAKDLALAFYEQALDRDAPIDVGEAMRRMRAGFGSGEGGSATPLAYVFYGHPDLHLRRGVGATGPVTATNQSDDDGGA